MAESMSRQQDDQSNLKEIIEACIRIACVVLLAGWCFTIIRPFITPVIWGIILAVAVFPAYAWVTKRMGDRRRLAATLFAIGGLLIVIIPTYFFTDSLVNTGQQIATQLDLDNFHIPPPPPKVEEWAVIGTPIAKIWEQASHGLEPLIVQFAPQLHGFAGWLVSASVSTGLAVLQSLLSIIIAGVLLASSTEGARTATSIATRLIGTQGQAYAAMASATVRSVAVGIIGVALIQATLIGLGMLIFSVPHAGLWTLLCLLLAVLQISPMLIVLPLIIYMFNNSPTGVAVAFMIWEVIASGSDNVLKPILLARGVKVPMIVIFMGVIGGFISAGFIGLFVGAVVLSMGYELFRAWMQEAEPGEETAVEGIA